jgi:hypothetical protein
VEAPPFTWREPFAREGHKLEKEERRGEISFERRIALLRSNHKRRKTPSKV